MGNHEYLTTAEVAALFHVESRTVALWVREGKLRAGRTPGGEHRFVAAEIHALLRGETPQRDGGTEVGR